MPEPITRPGPAPEPEPYNPDEPPPLATQLDEEGFDEKYNKRLEAPLALITAILIHVVIGAVLIVVLTVLMGKSEDKNLPPMQMSGIDGLDEYGEGAPNAKGEQDAEKINEDPLDDIVNQLPDPSKLPEIKENAVKLIDPDGKLPITASNAKALSELNDAVRKKLYGNPQGTDKKGKGPGGIGADSTLGRNMRWTLRFKVNSGRDYLEQLRAMDAKIIVPVPGTDKCILIEDLKNPNNQRTVGQDGLGPYAGLLKFADSRRAAVDGIAGAIGLDFKPATFLAVFSKQFEQDLARKETSYRDKRAEDIEETIFEVKVRGGEFTVAVVEQKMKR
jgi:hypothetical protein